MRKMNKLSKAFNIFLSLVTVTSIYFITKNTSSFLANSSTNDGGLTSNLKDSAAATKKLTTDTSNVSVVKMANTKDNINRGNGYAIRFHSPVATGSDPGFANVINNSDTANSYSLEVNYHKQITV
jgi:hypothetical protein